MPISVGWDIQYVTTFKDDKVELKIADEKLPAERDLSLSEFILCYAFPHLTTSKFMQLLKYILLSATGYSPTEKFEEKIAELTP